MNHETSAPAATSGKKTVLFRLALVLAACVLAFVASRILQQREASANTADRTIIYAQSVADDHPGLLRFRQDFPQRDVLLACEEDVTNDGKPDLLLVYRDGEHIRFVTAIAVESGCRYTEPIPAPVENQKIQFRNIDKKEEMEFIISGEKDGAAGYAIYRIIDGEPKDLFGEGMNDCC